MKFSQLLKDMWLTVQSWLYLSSSSDRYMSVYLAHGFIKQNNIPVLKLTIKCMCLEETTVFHNIN